MPFESVIQPINGNFTAVVQDLSGTTPGESTIIRVTDAWEIRVQWNLTGAAAPALGGANRRWRLQAFAESIGPGFEDSLTPAPIMVAVNVPAGSPPFTYTVPIPVPAFTLAAGAYRLVTLLTLVDGLLATDPPLAVAAYQEGPIVQIYAPA